MDELRTIGFHGPSMVTVKYVMESPLYDVKSKPFSLKVRDMFFLGTFDISLQQTIYYEN